MTAYVETSEVAYERPYVARRPFQYGDMNLDADQVFMLAHQVNDERLVRLNYCGPAPKGASVVQCKYCGGKFCTDTGLSMHGRKRHSSQSVPTVREDKKGLTPDELQRDLKRAEQDPRVMRNAMGVEEAKTSVQVEEERLLSEPARAIHLDKTAASIKSGDAVPEITTKKKRGRPRKEK